MTWAMRVTQWVLILAGLGAVATGLRLTRPQRPAAAKTAVLHRRTVSFVASDSGALLRLGTRRSLFRAHQRPPNIRFGSIPPAVALSSTPPIPKPALRLTGVLLGDSAVALVEGLPGFDQAVAWGEGQSQGEFRLVLVARNRVTITGMDTTWLLTVREPW